MKYPVEFTCRECECEWDGKVEEKGYELNFLPREDCPLCGSLSLEAIENVELYE